MIRRCTTSEILEATELLAEYASESSIDGMPTPKAKILTYKRLEFEGSIVCFGAFCNDKLVGFVSILMSILPHYSAPAAIVESIFVSSKHRAGCIGGRLLKAAENHAKNSNASGLLISAPFGGNLAKLLEKTKSYRTTNLIFFKRVDNVS